MAGLGVILMVLGVLAAVTSMVVVSTLSTIFQSGVYLYATTGQVPAVARSRPARERVPAEGEEVTDATLLCCVVGVMPGIAVCGAGHQRF